MSKIFQILKIFTFILIIKASFLVSFAFLWDDLWLDLYKNIDEWITKLNSKMYSYELKWAKPNWNISDNINKNIKSAWINWCEIQNITQQEVEEIAFWDDNQSPNISLLSQKLDWKCLKIWQLNKIQQIIKNVAIKSNNTAKSKAEDIYNISKQWLFSDGNIQNSPFDLVKDIKDIDYIIFTQDVKYEWEEGIDDDKLWKYLQWKLNNLENKINNKLNDNNQEDPDNRDKNKNSSWSTIENNWNSEINLNWDNTKYTCPDDNESWLSEDDLNNIKNWENNQNNWPLNWNYRWKINLWDNPFAYSTWPNISIWWNITSTIWKKPYQAVNDNNFFGWCKKFFCIKVEFLTHKWNLLIWWKTRSIQSIMERSNKHLEKFVNSSLVQAKMTTNNFELGLRDLDLSKIFSMPIVITKKTPPILNLDYLNREAKKNSNKKEDSNPLSENNLLKFRFEAIWINYKRENDLSIFEDSDYNRKMLINNAELNIWKIKKNSDERNKQIAELKKLDEHITRIVSSSYQRKETDWMYKEFVELENFTQELNNYVKAFDKVTDKMLSIPIHQ